VGKLSEKILRSNIKKLKLIILIIKTAEDLSYTKNIPVISDIPTRSLKRNKDYNDTEPEAPRLKFARVMASYVLLVKATDRDRNYINGVTNRVPIPTSYEAAVSDLIFGIQWQEAI
jgi:hypothetical protein